ncbi:MAG TPA: WYL domain-containing protein [Cytophagales bacterium]|nr:WYL domain-containing protein [Cytophagales bacterium]
MSTSKNQFTRFRIINKCLSSRRKKYWTRQEILDELEKYDIVVSVRTISYDVELMKYDGNLGFFAPIEFCNRNKGYYYTDPDYSIENVPLTKAEFKILANSLSFLKYKSAFKEFESVVDKLLRVGSQVTRQYDTSSIIDFEKAPYYKGEEFIDPLINYIRAKQPLKIKYQKFNSDQPSDYLVHPYYLKEYRNRWYLLCLHEELEELRTFALDRIIKLEPALLYYKENPLEEPSEYFENILGVTVATGPIEQIVLSFRPEYAPYLKTQSIHHSQKILLDNEVEFRIELKLIPNFELTSVILSYGKKLKVLAPESLKEKIESER